MLEVEREGREEADLFLVEIATYPDKRIPGQMHDDLELVYQNRRVLPDGIVIVLCPYGNVEVARFAEIESRNGKSKVRVEFEVIELWKFSARELLATGDPGLMPWVTLTDAGAEAETVLRECRKVIDEKAAPEEKESLLVVSQVLGSLRYNEGTLTAIIGGDRPMIESPLLERLFSEKEIKTKRQDLERVLRSRYGSITPEVSAAIQSINSAARLDELLDQSQHYHNLESFREELQRGQQP